MYVFFFVITLFQQISYTKCCMNAFVIKYAKLDFCLTVHHQLGKVIQMNQLDATMIY